MISGAVELLDNYVATVAAASALFWPILRVACRYFKRIKPYQKACYFIQDITNGAAFPYFCLMIMSPFGNNIVIESSIIFLAGVYGSHAIIRDVLAA